MPEDTAPGPVYRLLLSLGSLLFWTVFVLTVLLFSLLLVVFAWSPFHWRTQMLRAWIRINLLALRLFCGMRYEFEGLNQIPPQQACLYMSKHSSTWETLALQLTLPPLVWVVKQELIKLPVFGWCLRVQNAIPLQRGSGRKAVEKLLQHGKDRLQRGLSIMIFPEGTRVAVSEKRAYKNGGFILASQSDVPIIPIAHNAGEFWPRHSWIKWPGLVRVRIGAPISTSGKSVDELKQEVRAWIESNTDDLSDPRQRRLLQQLDHDGASR